VRAQSCPSPKINKIFGSKLTESGNFVSKTDTRSECEHVEPVTEFPTVEIEWWGAGYSDKVKLEIESAKESGTATKVPKGFVAFIDDNKASGGGFYSLTVAKGNELLLVTLFDKGKAQFGLPDLTPAKIERVAAVAVKNWK
jgi:hypothetical protein